MDKEIIEFPFELTYLKKDTLDIVTSNKLYDDENLIQIDGNIAPVIRILNLKGYKTQFCCEGHASTSDIYMCMEPLPDKCTVSAITPGYIYFEDGIVLPSIPDNWELDVSYESFDEDDNDIKGYWETIYMSNCENINSCEEFLEVKLKALLNLMNWVKQLPSINEIVSEEETKIEKIDTNDYIDTHPRIIDSTIIITPNILPDANKRCKYCDENGKCTGNKMMEGVNLKSRMNDMILFGHHCPSDSGVTYRCQCYIK